MLSDQQSVIGGTIDPAGDLINHSVSNLPLCKILEKP
jgi:hypothetical protein